MSDDRLQDVNYEFIKEWRAKTGFMVDLVNLDPGPTGRHVYNEPDIWLGPGSIPKYLIDAKSKTVLINWNRPGVVIITDAAGTQKISLGGVGT